MLSKVKKKVKSQDTRINTINSQRALNIITNSTHLFQFTLQEKKWHHRQKTKNYSYFFSVLFDEQVLLSFGTDKILSTLDKQQLKVSLLETDIDDPFFIYKFCNTFPCTKWKKPVVEGEKKHCSKYKTKHQHEIKTLV